MNRIIEAKNYSQKLKKEPLCVRVLAGSVEDIWDADFVDHALKGTEIEMPKLSLGAIVGIVIGSVAAFLILNIIYAVWRRRKMIMQLNSQVGTADLSNLEGGHGGAPSGHGLYYKAPKFSSKNEYQQKSGTSWSGSSIPYSGNPLTPNGPPVKGKRQLSQAYSTSPFSGTL